MECRAQRVRQSWNQGPRSGSELGSGSGSGLGLGHGHGQGWGNLEIEISESQRASDPDAEIVRAEVMKPPSRS